MSVLWFKTIEISLLGMLINNLKDGVKELKVENYKQAENVSEVKNLLMKIKLQSGNLVFFFKCLYIKFCFPYFFKRIRYIYG